MIYDVQKAGLFKRFSAFLLDFVLLIVLAGGFAWLLSWITGLNKYTNTMQNYYKEYGEEYGVNFDISAADYDKLTEEERDLYQEAYSAIFHENSDAMKAYNMSTTLPFMIVTLSLLLSCVVFEFVIPLCLKNGQTVGKKVFGLGVVFNNSVKISNFALFVRAIFGKYTIELMFPVMLVMLMLYRMMGIISLILVAALFILQIVLLIVTHNNLLIHDILASTVVVDMSSQMIFASTQELVAYKEQLAREKAENEGKTYTARDYDLADVPVGEEHTVTEHKKKSKRG